MFSFLGDEQTSINSSWPLSNGLIYLSGLFHYSSKEGLVFVDAFPRKKKGVQRNSEI